jgi:pimeloyl-ACP methyl ester carboxylesterase
LTTVFLHPLGLDSKCWDLLNLEDCVLLDLAGHGSRSNQVTGPRIEELSKDVFEQINSINGSEVFDFVGLSLGAAVAMNFALEHPERVRSMVLACTSAKANTQVMEDRAKSVEALGLPGVLESTLERWFTPEILALGSHSGVSYARKTLLKNSVENFARSWRILGSHNVLDNLSEIQCPVTVVAGKKDMASSFDGLKEISEKLPLAEFVVAGGPHMLQLETPIEFHKIVKDHLTRVANQP